MKKKLRIFLAFVLLAIFIFSNPTTINATSDIKVLVEGQELAFDVPPQIIEGRTLLPLRGIFENLGLKVAWDEQTKTITATNEETEIILRLNSLDARVDGFEERLDVPAKAINGRTMVPVRFIAESLNMNVAWDGANKTVKINEVEIRVSARQAIEIVEEKTGYLYGAERHANTGQYITKPESKQIFGARCWVIPAINPNTNRHDGDLYVDWLTGDIYNMAGENPWK